MTVVNMESLILNFWLSFANKIRDGVTKKPTICEHGVSSLTFFFIPACFTYAVCFRMNRNTAHIVSE